MIALFHGYYQLLTVSDLLIKLYYMYVLIGGRKEVCIYNPELQRSALHTGMLSTIRGAHLQLTDKQTVFFNQDTQDRIQGYKTWPVSKPILIPFSPAYGTGRL